MRPRDCSPKKISPKRDHKTIDCNQGHLKSLKKSACKSNLHAENQQIFIPGNSVPTDTEDPKASRHNPDRAAAKIHHFAGWN